MSRTLRDEGWKLAVLRKGTPSRRRHVHSFARADSEIWTCPRGEGGRHGGRSRRSCTQLRRDNRNARRVRETAVEKPGSEPELQDDVQRACPPVICFPSPGEKTNISRLGRSSYVRTYSQRRWRDLGVQMVQASGASKEQAEVVTDVLISGSLRGIDSHGVRILPYFSEKGA